MSSGKGATRPFPNYGITAKIKARDLSPLRAGGGGDDFAVRVRVHDLRPLPQPADTERASARL